MPRLYTEIRISHSTEEEKEIFEKEFDKILEYYKYKTRIEWVREQIRELFKKYHGCGYKNIIERLRDEK